MQRPTTLANFNIHDGKETVEEVKQGNKTLRLYRRRASPSPSQSTNNLHPDQELNKNIELPSPDSMRTTGSFENVWKSDEDLFPPPPPFPLPVQNNADDTFYESDDVHEEQDCVDIPHVRSTNAGVIRNSDHLSNTGRHKDDLLSSRYPMSKGIDSRIQSKTNESFVDQTHSSINSSNVSSDSSGKRYLDVYGDKSDQQVIGKRNIRDHHYRKGSIPSIGVESSVSKYSTNIGYQSPSIIDKRSPSIEYRIPSVDRCSPSIDHRRSTSIDRRSPSIDRRAPYPYPTASALNHVQHPMTLKSISNTNTTSSHKNKPPPRYGDWTVDVIRHRIQICKYVSLFFVITAAIICLLVGILHYYVGYYPQVFHLNEGDIKLVPASSSFCSDIIAVSRSSDLRVIVFRKKSKQTTSLHTITGKMKIVPLEIWRRDFYLESGTTVSMKVSSTHTFDVLIFKGWNKFLIWSQRKQSSTYMKKVPCCADNMNKEKTITFTADSSGRYYIVIHSQLEIIPVMVNLEILFTRNSFDFTDTTRQCLSTKGDSCSVSYAFAGGEDAAIEIPISNHGNRIPESSRVECKCVARVWFYVVIFLLVFILVCFALYVTFYVTVEYLIRGKRYCCAIMDDKNESTEFLYHDHHMKDKIWSNDNHDNIIGNNNGNTERSVSIDNCHAIGMISAPSTTSNRVSLYKVRSSPSVSTNRSAYSIKKSYHPSTTYQKESDIATIYEGGRFIADTADSGIVDPDFMPTRHSYKEDIIQLKELQILRTSPRATHMILTDVPRVSHMISERGTRDNMFTNNNDSRFEYEVGSKSRTNYGYEPTITTIHTSSPLPQNVFTHAQSEIRSPRKTNINEIELNELSSMVIENPHSFGERSRTRTPDSLDPEMYI